MKSQNEDDAYRGWPYLIIVLLSIGVERLDSEFWMRVESAISEEEIFDSLSDR